MSIIDSIRKQLAPIHPEGYPFVGGFAFVSIVLLWLWSPLGWLATLATLWCAYFFRDPQRVTPLRDGIVVAPADGRVSQIVNAVPPQELDLGSRPLPRISIFMSVFDCHVNRSPVAGRIERIVYHAGKFLSADLDKASATPSSSPWRTASTLPPFRSRALWRGASCRSSARARRSPPVNASA
jgi:phosphatidylserine decarboxylase